MKSAAMSVSVLLAAAISVYGADYYVSPGNAGAQAPYSTWETAAATIEDAMALAILDMARASSSAIPEESSRTAASPGARC